MGEKKEETKTKLGAEKTKNEAGGIKDDGLATVVLKLDLHCEGCAKKVKRYVRHLQGVEDVKADYNSGKLTVKGNVDPFWLMEKVANKTKKKVDLFSAQPKNYGVHGSRDKNSEERIKKKAAEAEEKADHKIPKEPQIDTVVMKIQLHCDRCAEKVKRIIQKIDGVQEVSVSLEKNLVTLNGTMDMKELTIYLKNKLKRHIDVMLPKKDDDNSGGNDDYHEEGESVVVSGESANLKEIRTEVLNKMEYYGSNANTYYAMPMYGQNYMGQDYGVTMHNTGYGHTGYVPPPPPPVYLTTTQMFSDENTPQMFSDENPNGCSIM